MLELADSYPRVYERYPEIEGLLAEVLARREQEKFMAPARQGGREKPGCLLGWLVRSGRAGH